MTKKGTFSMSPWKTLCAEDCHVENSVCHYFDVNYVTMVFPLSLNIIFIYYMYMKLAESNIHIYIYSINT